MNTNETLNYMDSLIEDAKKAGRKLEVHVNFNIGDREGRFEFNTEGVRDVYIKKGAWHQYEIDKRLSFFIVLNGWDEILDKNNAVTINTDQIEISRIISIINHKA